MCFIDPLCSKMRVTLKVEKCIYLSVASVRLSALTWRRAGPLSPRLPASAAEFLSRGERRSIPCLRLGPKSHRKGLHLNINLSKARRKAPL